MIKLLYFSYALHKRKVLILSTYSILVLTKKILAEGVKVQFVLDFPPLYGARRYAVVFRSRQDIASTIERWI